jgi:hypothetical protein
VDRSLFQGPLLVACDLYPMSSKNFLDEEIASDRDFGHMRAATPSHYARLPGHRAALLGRPSCFWGCDSSISAELRVCRDKDLTRRVELREGKASTLTAQSMDAKQYADEIVDPTITEFEREPWSRRRAFLACVATFHLMDYIPEKPREEKRREKYRRECPAFAAVDRYAHAFKHARTGHDNPRSPIRLLKAGQIFGRPPGTAGAMETGLSLVGDATGGVSVAGEDVRDLLYDVNLRSKL